MNSAQAETLAGNIASELHLPHGELIRLVRQTGFEIEALHELQAPVR